MTGRTAGGQSTRRARQGAGAALLVALALALLLAPQAASAADRSKLGGREALTPEPMTLAFWAGESVPGTDWDEPATYWNLRATRTYTPRVWRVLSRYRIPIYLNLRYKRDFGPVPAGMPRRNDGLRIVRKANRLGVPVWGWVLIPFSDGYWAWEGAAAEQFEATRALVRWAREKRLRLRGVALDPEPRLRTPFESTATIMGGNAGGASFSAVFQPRIEPLAQCAALQTYARIPRWGERHGVRVAAAPMPAALDDVEDGRLALQDAADFILPRGPWHAIYFQVYRSVFNYYSGRDPGPGIVSSYYRSAQAQYGAAGQLSFGSTGRGPYKRFAALLHDVRLAATLGATELPLYSLERTLNAYGGPSSIARLARAAQHPFAGPAASKAIKATTGSGALRAAVRRADRAAASATPGITAARGTRMSANAWPDGCGG